MLAQRYQSLRFQKINDTQQKIMCKYFFFTFQIVIVHSYYVLIQVVSCTKIKKNSTVAVKGLKFCSLKNCRRQGNIMTKPKNLTKKFFLTRSILDDLRRQIRSTPVHQYPKAHNGNALVTFILKVHTLGFALNRIPFPKIVVRMFGRKFSQQCIEFRLKVIMLKTVIECNDYFAHSPNSLLHMISSISECEIIMLNSKFYGWVNIRNSKLYGWIKT